MVSFGNTASVIITLLIGVHSTLISDSSDFFTLSLVLLSDSGNVRSVLNTSYSTFEQYTAGIADVSTPNVYLLVSDPPGIIWSNRTYRLVTLNTQTKDIKASDSTFHVAGVYPYGLTLGPNGNVIVSGQSGSVMYYYLVDPNSGVSTVISTIDIKNSFIFPDAMLYDFASNTIFHPYCDEPEHFIGVVVVDVAGNSAKLVTTAHSGDLWFRPAVYNPQTSQLVGLLRDPHSAEKATLVSWSFDSRTFTTIGSPFAATKGITFKGADLSSDGKTLFITGSNGFFGLGTSFLMTVDVGTGVGTISQLNFFPVNFLSYVPN